MADPTDAAAVRYSRTPDFLTTDDEKPWRDRETEFLARTVDRAELREKWESGWTILFRYSIDTRRLPPYGTATFH